MLVHVFLSQWGLKPECTDSWGLVSLWGPKVRSSWVNIQIIRNYFGKCKNAEKYLLGVGLV